MQATHQLESPQYPTHQQCAPMDCASHRIPSALQPMQPPQVIATALLANAALQKLPHHLSSAATYLVGFWQISLAATPLKQRLLHRLLQV